MAIQKKPARVTPIKRNPLFQGLPGLSFGNISEEDLIKLTDDEKCEKFLSKYMDVVDPIVRYESYFKSSAKGISMIFKELKSYYKKLVVNSTWSEKKYVSVVNHIFENNLTLSIFILDRLGFMHDQGDLDNNSNNSSIRRVRR